MDHHTIYFIRASSAAHLCGVAIISTYLASILGNAVIRLRQETTGDLIIMRHHIASQWLSAWRITIQFVVRMRQHFSASGVCDWIAIDRRCCKVIYKKRPIRGRSIKFGPHQLSISRAVLKYYTFYSTECVHHKIHPTAQPNQAEVCD